MKQYLLPVWGDARYVPAAKDMGLDPKKDEWWDLPPLNYGHCLISYVHWKRPFRFPAGAHVFGDSGGFTLRHGGKPIRIDPVDVLHWQASMCTVGCILDKPPGAGTAVTVGPKKDSQGPRKWDDGMRVTLANVRRALPSYLKMKAAGHAFRWWGCLHGNTEDEVLRYHAAVSEVYPFTDEGEGWAIRPEPFVDMYATARSLRLLNGLGIRRAHFLAATSQPVIAVLLALGPQSGLEFLTYDSAYAIKSGFNRHGFIPADDWSAFTISTEVGDDRHVREYLEHKCPCEVCAHLRARVDDWPRAQREMRQEKFGGWWSLWFQMHDLHVQLRVMQTQAEAAEKHPEEFLRGALDARDYSRVMRIFAEPGHEHRAIVPTGNTKSLLEYL